MFCSYTKESILSRVKTEMYVFLASHLSCSEFIAHKHDLFFKLLKAEGLHLVLSSPMTCLQSPFAEIHDISSARQPWAHLWLPPPIGVRQEELPALRPCLTFPCRVTFFSPSATVQHGEPFWSQPNPVPVKCNSATLAVSSWWTSEAQCYIA